MLEEKESLEVLRQKVGAIPELAVVLGSGWKRVLDEVEREAEIGYGELFGIESSVPGHEGKLVVGAVGGRRAAFMSGRVHMYEGLSAGEATMPIRVLAQAGMKRLILTAASGGLNEKYQVGDLVILSDVLTLLLSLDNPLAGPQFVDMSQALDSTMRARARSICSEERVAFREGVYAFYRGPSFETPADKVALGNLGADVVGMSTVPELIQARALGVAVLGLALVTNLAFVKHDHLEVLVEAEKASEKLGRVIAKLVSQDYEA